jgi:acyl-CoA synthetase (AMP-forming)/AMP-acid ligase II
MPLLLSRPLPKVLGLSHIENTFYPKRTHSISTPLPPLVHKHSHSQRRRLSARVVCHIVVVVLLWLYCCGCIVVVVLLWLYCCGCIVVVVLLWLYCCKLFLLLLTNTVIINSIDKDCYYEFYCLRVLSSIRHT